VGEKIRQGRNTLGVMITSLVGKEGLLWQVRREASRLDLV
jgi:hypothetical protein